jgi:hypothetical protein
MNHRIAWGPDSAAPSFLPEIDHALPVPGLPAARVELVFSWSVVQTGAEEHESRVRVLGAVQHGPGGAEDVPGLAALCARLGTTESDLAARLAELATDRLLPAD